MPEITSWEVVIKKFINKLEKDEDFFNYFNVSEDEAIELAQSRAENYLIEVADEIMDYCNPTPYVNLSDYDEELKVFNYKMFNSDKNIFAELMLTKYMEKDLPKLHVFETNFTPNDLKVFSPANERTSYRGLIEQYHKKNDKSIDRYNSHNRETGKLIGIDYAKCPTYSSNNLY